MQNDIILIICGLAGVLFHCILKCKSLLEYAQAANVEFHWQKDYLRKDYLAIVLSLLSVGIWYLIFGEVVASYPKLSAFARVSYVVMGVMGSYIIQLALSRTKKKITQIVDTKTNQLDNMKGTTGEKTAL